MNYRGSDGVWRPIDSTLRREAGGRWRTRAGESTVEFAGAGASAFGGGVTSAATAEPGQLLGADTATRLASIRIASGQRVEYGLTGAAGVEPRVSGATATYADILPHTDVELVALNDGVVKTIIIKSPEAATQWVFPLTLQGLTPRADKDGSISLLDRSGAPALVIPPGWMRDSKMDAANDGAMSNAVTYELITVEGKLALRISADPAWVRDPARVFPIRVDPTMQPAASGSTYVQVRTSDGACCTNNNSGTPEMKVGYHSDGPWRTRSFLKFDTVAWTNPGYRVWSANLHVSVAWSGSCPSTPWSTISAYDVTSPWTTSSLTNRNNQPAIGVEMGTVGGNPDATVCGNQNTNYNVGQWWTIPMNGNGAAVRTRWTIGGSNYGLAVGR